MPKYELRVVMQLINIDADEVAASSERNYAVGGEDDVGVGVGQAIAHAGQSFTLFIEGVQKLGLQDEG